MALTAQLNNPKISAVLAGGTPLVTVTFWGFPKSQRFWALAQMGISRFHLSRMRDLRFWKLMGCGHGSGFSLQPDWSRYALLCVWDSPDAAENFLNKSRLVAKYNRHASEMWTVFLLPVQANGRWNGSNPFLPLATISPDENPVVVLTRATIRPSRLRAFWQMVPKTSAALDAVNGRILSIGIGEAPFIRQATLSVWENPAAIREYAYKNPDHIDAMRRTRSENWYSEELFARFLPIGSAGKWNGVDPLAKLFD